MKNNNNILDRDSASIDILKDIDFLRLFRFFILDYGKNQKSKNISNLFTDFSRKDYLEHFQNKNEYNLFQQFYTFFSDNLNKTVFFETIREFDLNQEKLNLFLNIGEYLENIGNKTKEFPNGFYSVSDGYKEKIGEIIKTNNIEQTSSLLLKNGYPNFSAFNHIIKDCDFGNSITYNTLNGEDKFVWCVDEGNNSFYQSKSGKILRDNQNKIIIHIDINSVKIFGDYRIYSAINEDGEGKIVIEDNLFASFSEEIEGDSFNIKEIKYEDIVEDEYGKLVDKEENFEYLLINRGAERRLFTKEMSEITIMDLLEFLNRNNKATLNVVKKTLSKFEEIVVSDIFEIYDFYGIKFLKLNTDLLENNNDEEYEEEHHIILMSNGKILEDRNEFGNAYIRSLGEENIFLDKIFVDFSLTDFGNIDGYVDSHGKVVYIKDKKLLNIEMLDLELKGKKVYGINSFSKKINDGLVPKNNRYKGIRGKSVKDYSLVLTEEELQEEFSKYVGFESIGTEFEIGTQGNETIKIGNKHYNKIIGILKDDGELLFYLEQNEKRIKINYNFLLNNLKETKFGRDALQKLNQTLSIFEKSGII